MFLRLLSQISTQSEAIINQNRVLIKIRLMFLYSGSTKNPTFKGKNATTFIVYFEELLDEYKLEATFQRKYTLLERSVEYILRTQIRSLYDFNILRGKKGDQISLRQSFLSEFKVRDTDRIIGTVTYLKELYNRERSIDSNLRRFYAQFSQSNRLILEEELNSLSRTKLLLRRLPRPLIKVVQKRYSIKESEPSTYTNFGTILRITKSLIE